MAEMLRFNIDKFTFQVATDRWYSNEGVWAKWEGMHVVIGLSDYVQQRSGDVAFVELKPAGSLLNQGEEVAVIETIKVNIAFTSPVSGKVVEVNPAMAEAPEAINQDPFGDGWLAVIKAADWTADCTRLYDAQVYFAHMKVEAEEESNRL